jgi:ABC-type amino acid transport system permease subunit
MFAMQAQEETSRGIEVYLAVTALYVVSAFAINRIMAFIEKRVRVPGFVAASTGGEGTDMMNSTSPSSTGTCSGLRPQGLLLQHQLTGGRHHRRHRLRHGAGADAAVGQAKWLDVPAAIYVNGMRSIPLVMVILWFFLLVPLRSSVRPIGAGADLGGHHLHRVRGGVLLRDHARRHPVDLARPGVRRPGGGHDLRPEHALVILPQAFRNMLPVLLTQTIILFQDTSLVYAIGAYDLLKGFTVAGKNFGRPRRGLPARRRRLLRHLLRRCPGWSSGCRRRSPSFAEAQRTPMSDKMIEIKNVSKWYGPGAGAQRLHHQHQQGRRGRGLRALGLGQVHADQDRQRAGALPEGRDLRRRHPVTTPRPTCPSCAAASAWCSSTSSCSRTCR